MGAFFSSDRVAEAEICTSSSTEEARELSLQDLENNMETCSLEDSSQREPDKIDVIEVSSTESEYLNAQAETSSNSSAGEAQESSSQELESDMESCSLEDSSSTSSSQCESDGIDIIEVNSTEIEYPNTETGIDEDQKPPSSQKLKQENFSPAPLKWVPPKFDISEVSLMDILCATDTLEKNLTPVPLCMAMRERVCLDKPFLIAYVAALIDENNAILMVPAKGDRSEVTIRMTKNTSVGNSNKSIDCSTLFLTQEVWVYQVIITMDKNVMFPTWSAAQFSATSVIPRGPIPSKFSTIGFAYKDLSIVLAIVSDETPSGFRVNRSIVNPNQVEQEELCPDPCLGEMLIVDVYPLREGTKIRKMSDMDFYVTDNNQLETVCEQMSEKVYKSNIKGVYSIARATEFQKKICQSKGYSLNISRKDEEFFIGRGTASMAAFEAYTQNVGRDRYIVRKDSSASKIVMNREGVFTSSFSFSCEGFDGKGDEVWAVGASINAVFPVGMGYQIPVEITSFVRRRGEGFATVEFPETATEFLKSWNMVGWSEGEIVYDPTDSEDFVRQAIRTGFQRLATTDIFQQYLGALKPIKTKKKLSAKQRKVGGVELDESQVEAMKSILNTDGISLTQSPPGSGKTVLVAAVTRGWLRSGEAKTVVITGTSNIAVDNALNTLNSIADELESFRPVRVASQKAMCQLAEIRKELLKSEKAMSFENYISSEVHRKKLAEMREEVQQLTKTAMERGKSKKMVVNRYAKVRNAKGSFENSFMKALRPNVIATTTSLLLRNRKQSSFKNVTHILIDEASQLATTEFLAILAAFPNLKKVALIGDEYQLQPHSTLPDDSDAKKCFGTSDLVRLNRQFGGTATKLKRVYRSHPLMTLNLINTFYPYKLEAGAKAENRILAEQLKLPICDDGTPVRAYHVEGQEFKGANVVEAAAIFHFVKKLISKRTEPEEILVLTFHRSQRCLLEQHLPNGVRVRTVDSAQGQQAPITIVATTKTSFFQNPYSIVRSLQFVSNKNRGTVALSRGLEATYIFGNLRQLSLTSFWRPVIDSLCHRDGISWNSEYTDPDSTSALIRQIQTYDDLLESTNSNVYKDLLGSSTSCDQKVDNGPFSMYSYQS